MSVVDINPAIRTKIYNFADANSYDVAWPNEEFEPSDTYLRFYVMPSDTTPFGMGVGSVEDYSGILQIDIVFKVNSGMSEAEAIKSNIATEFQKGSYEEYNGTKVLFETLYPAKSMRDSDEAWMYIPVSIKFRCLT